MTVWAAITYPKIWKETKKYLAYESRPNYSGFLHQWADLDIVCLEAALTNRIPVLSKKLTLPSHHNPAGPALSSWERYWDIEETKIYIYRYYPFSKRIIHQTTYPIPVLWIDDLSGWISKKSHKIVSTEALQDSCLAECELIYRKLPSHKWPSYFDGIQSTNLTHIIIKKIYQLARYGYLEKAFFHRKPSSEIWAVVVDIVKQLEANFWAIHIRRNDTLVGSVASSYPHAKYASNIPWIVANLNCAGLNKNTPIFLMTDERNPLYLSALEKKLNIIHASDFKAYQNLVEKYPDDNFLCFQIERLIYLHAKRRYRTATYWGEVFEFTPFPEPICEILNHLPPHYPLPVDRKRKYFSYLSLEGNYNHKIKWELARLYFKLAAHPLSKRSPSLLSLRYSLAQKILQLRLKLRRY